MAKRKPWRKNLYGNQEYPDNYTDESFLKELQININFTPISLWDGVTGASLVVNQLCTVVFFTTVYVYLYNKWIDSNLIFYCTGLMTILGLLIYRLYFSTGLKLGHDLRTVLIFLVFGQLFSPVLHTLTDTVSTDTIYTMSFFMMLIHLIFFDYGVPAAIVSNSLSLSAAVFASICLSSRLASPYQAFILMTVSIKCFVLFPILRNKLKSTIVTVLLVILVICILSTVSTSISFLFVLTIIFVNIICPILFIKYQRYKDNIYGPWDEAVVQGIDRENE